MSAFLASARRWARDLIAGDLTGLLFSAFVAFVCIVAFLLVAIDLVTVRELCEHGFWKFC